MSLPATPWTGTFHVRTDAVTPQGTATVPALCALLQEAAGRHADALDVSMQHLQAEGRAWALAHLRLALDHPLRWDTPLTVETWPSGLDGLYATREFVLWADDVEIGRATSRWFVLDTERRRPVRPPRSLYDLETPNRPRPLAPKPEDLSPPARLDHTLSRTVRHPDLDLNGHLNSVRTLTWALRPLPDALHETHRCARVALQFRAEAARGVPVRVTAQVEDAGDDRIVHHALHNTDASTLLTTARTVWTPRAQGPATP